jgi:hypothetical protein
MAEEKAVARDSDLDTHIKMDWKAVHGLWKNITDPAVSVLLSRAKFRVYVSSAMDNLTANAWTKLVCNGVTYNPGGHFDAVTNHRFTAPVTGYYHFDAHAEFDTGIGSSNTFEISMYVDNAAVNNHKVSTNAEGDAIGLQVSDTLYLTAGQYVEVFVKSNNVATADIANTTTQTWFSGHILSVY